MVTPLNKNSQMQKIDNLEIELFGVKTDLASVKTNVDNVLSNISEIRSLISNINDARKTNWATLASLAAVLLSIVFYHNQITMSPINNILADQKLKNEQFEQHMIDGASFGTRFNIDEKNILELEKQTEKLALLVEQLKLYASSNAQKLEDIQKQIDKHLEDGHPHSVIIRILELQCEIAAIKAKEKLEGM